MIGAYGEKEQIVKMSGASGGTEKKIYQHHTANDSVDFFKVSVPIT